MTEAIIGLVGVIVGSMITVTKDYFTSHTQINKRAHYSAI